jgi:hypothetical protein
MVSAVSSQAATLNPLAYAAQTDDDTSKQAAPDATANDTDRGPATQVSVSQASKNLLVAAEQSGQGILDAYQAGSDAIHKQWDTNQVSFQLKMLDQQDSINESITVSLKSQREDLDKWMNTEPVPAVQLTEAQIAEILKKVASRGIDPSKIGSADNYSFGDDGKLYTFKKDGTAWVNEAGVPTSEEQKKYVYPKVIESMAYQATRIQDTSAARESLTAQLNALMGQ